MTRSCTCFRRITRMKSILISAGLACLVVANGMTQDAGEPQQGTAEPTQGSTLAEPLESLQWMVGAWVDRGDDTTIVTKCSWTKNRKFLKRSFELKADGQVT